MTHNKSANFGRGEAHLMIDDIAYIIRPSFAALVATEDEIGSLFDFVDRAADGKALLGEVVAIFWNCLTDTQDMSRGQFSEHLTAMGMVGLTPILKVVLRQILQGQ